MHLKKRGREKEKLRLSKKQRAEVGNREEERETHVAQVGAREEEEERETQESAVESQASLTAEEMETHIPELRKSEKTKQIRIQTENCVY